MDDPIIHEPGCGWETGPFCTCGADPERMQGDHTCGYYSNPEQDCLTAGPEVLAAEGVCGACARRMLNRIANVNALADRWDQEFTEGRAMRDEYGNQDGVTRMRRLDQAAADIRDALGDPLAPTAISALTQQDRERIDIMLRDHILVDDEQVVYSVITQIVADHDEVRGV